jgi:dihydroorotase
MSVGAPADLVLFDDGAPFVMNRETLQSKSRNTPFDGMRMQGKVLETYVSGTCIYKAS